MNYQWFLDIHVLFLVVSVSLILFLRLNPELGKWGRVFWVAEITGFLYITIYAKSYPASGSWDDIVFGLMFAFATYAMLTTLVSRWLYLFYIKRS